MAENKLNEMIGESLEKVKELAGTDTVIGEPIYTKTGTVIIPVSKVSMGFATGSFDYDTTASENPKTKSRCGGGGGTGITVTPIAFLVVTAEGKIELVPITNAQNVDSIDKITALIERSPDILQRLKEVLFSKKKKPEEVAEEDTAAQE